MSLSLFLSRGLDIKNIWDMCRFEQSVFFGTWLYYAQQLNPSPVVTFRFSVTLFPLPYKSSPYFAPSDSSIVFSLWSSIPRILSFIPLLCFFPVYRDVSLGSGLYLTLPPNHPSLKSHHLSFVLIDCLTVPIFCLPFLPSLLLLFSQTSIFQTEKPTTWHSERRMNRTRMPYKRRNLNVTTHI